MVVGYDKERKMLKQLKEMLLDYSAYVAKGVRIPKGVLVSGDPGVGKTVMVREMFQGINVVELKAATFTKDEIPSKIESIFKEAKSNTPCVVFIDELDKIAGDRKGFERLELTQASKVLLGELDKLSNNDSLLVVATCNDKDAIPSMLIRSGRFDRIINIGYPSNDSRDKIIEYYLSKLKIEKDFRFDDLSNQLRGMTGAEIENYINEASIIAIHKESKVLTLDDFKEAISDRAHCGLAGDLAEDYEERHLTAVHEAGHAVSALILTPNMIDSVTIIPRGESGGYMAKDAVKESTLRMKDYLNDIVVGLSGKAAEMFVFGDISFGCRGDIEKAFEIVKKIASSSYFGFAVAFGEGDVMSELSDKANERMALCLEEQYSKAYKLIEENKDLFYMIVDELERKKTLTKQELIDIMEEVKSSKAIGA